MNDNLKNNCNSISLIKEGGFGKIYKANHKIYGWVAIKEIKISEQLSQSVIFNEIQILTEIKSEHFPKFYEFYSNANSFYIVLEFIEGQNLSDYVKNNSNINDTNTAIRLFIQISKAVLEFHKLGFIHRDIKPSNFMITKNEEIKLIDFGISYSLTNPKPVVNQFKALTKDFASPEQIKNQPLDIRSDIFSLGKTFHFILNNCSAITEPTVVLDPSINVKKRNNYSNNIDEKLFSIIRKATESDKSKRYDSVFELFKDLEELENNSNKVGEKTYTIKASAGFVPSFALKHINIDKYKSKLSFKIRIASNKIPKAIGVKEKKIFDVLTNYIKRGNPTYCSIRVEKHYLSKYPDLIEKVEKNGEILFEFYNISDNRKILEEIIEGTILIGKYQRVICFLLSNGLLSIEEGEWNFNVEDKFVEIFRLAISDLLETLEHYYNLNNLNLNKPKINISKTAKIHILFQTNKVKLERDELYITLEELGIEYDEPVESNYNIDYEIDEKKHLNSLVYFLQNIFRKVKFRNGQIEIIERALSLKNTIGLLPTGAGKSLCYQFITFMQPGIFLVIEPIKSLIVDQTYNIEKFLISSVGYLTVDLITQKRDVIQNKFKEGIIKILLISPERLQNEKFRNYLKECADRSHINFAIIDEAHCVSEWGHDFRTSYLNLARTIRKICCKNGRIPVFYALTATASEIVLQDIKSDLELEHNDSTAVIRNISLDRPELEFIIEKVPSSKKFDALNEIFFELAENFGYNNPEYMVKNKKVPGLIFCPHVNTTAFSITKVNQLIGRKLNLTHDNRIRVDEVHSCPKCNSPLKKRKNSFTGEFFWGCSSYPKCRYTSDFISNGNKVKVLEFFEETRIFGGDNLKGINEDVWIEYKNKGQYDFIENRASLMVSTKAFGMGIDKRDIRFTIHYNLPQSMESFYQEAGRAGRDGKKAYCYIIFSDDYPNISDRKLDPSKTADEIWNDVDDNVDSDVGRNLFFQKNSYRGYNDDLYKIKNYLDYEFFNKIESADMYKQYNLNKLSNNESESNDFEKILFRLKIIGLVEDYTIDYSYKNRNYIITLNKSDNLTYIENLRNYLIKQGVSNIDRFLNEREIKQVIGNYSDTIIYCVKKILEFVYSKIEPQRRRSLLNLLQAARSSNADEFRQKVLMYLDPSEEINFYFRIFPQSKNYEEWSEIIKVAINKNKVNNFLGVALRILESYPDNVGLLYVTFGLRCLLINENTDIILQDFNAFIRFSDESFDSNYTIDAIISLLDVLFSQSKVNLAVSYIIGSIIERNLMFDQVDKLLKIKTNNIEHQKILTIPALKIIKKLLESINKEFYHEKFK